MENIEKETNNLEKPGILIGYYGFWVILTYVNAVAGLIGMYFALNGNIRLALILLMFAGLCDGLDGRVASLKERTDRQKNYGIQIDAFADIISFGLLPVVIGYIIITGYDVQLLTSFYLAISVVFILASLIRLAYFNVIETEHLNKNEKRTFFVGLPVTTVSLLIPIVYSLCCVFNLPLPLIYAIMLAGVSVVYVVRIKIPKPRGRLLVLLCLAALPAAIYIIFLGGN